MRMYMKFLMSLLLLVCAHQFKALAYQAIID